MNRYFLAPALVFTAIAVAQTGSAAAQSDAYAIRAIGITKLETTRTAVNTLAVACVTPGTNSFVDCVPKGSAVLKVDSATKRKLKLASAVIAKGPIVAKAAGGEGEDGGRVTAAASSAVRKKLKTLKTVTVTYTLTITGPIQEVITKKLSMTTTSSGVKRLLLRSSGDDVSLAGGRG
jgi:hypothetical protein